MLNIQEKEFKILLGATVDNCLVFANVDFKRGYFSVSFDEVQPFVYDEVQAREYLAEKLANASNEWLADQFVEYPDRTFNELVDDILYYEGAEAVYDISIFPECFRIDGVEEDIYFESIGCGQHDTRERFFGGQLFISWTFFNLIHELWDKYHLVPLDSFNDEDEDKLQELYNLCEEYEGRQADLENDWIEHWLKQLYEQGELVGA